MLEAIVMDRPKMSSASQLSNDLLALGRNEFALNSHKGVAFSAGVSELFWIILPAHMHSLRLYGAVWGWCEAVDGESVQQCLLRSLESFQHWLLCSLPGQSSAQ